MAPGVSGSEIVLGDTTTRGTCDHTFAQMHSVRHQGCPWCRQRALGDDDGLIGGDKGTVSRGCWWWRRLCVEGQGHMGMLCTLNFSVNLKPNLKNKVFQKNKQ